MTYIPPCMLDGKPVEKITAFLFDQGGHDDPAVLFANAHKSFVGSYVLGMGFTFDDSNPDATPIAEMHRLMAQDPRNAERIFPYIGGEEVNTSPTHAHHRYVINFGDLKEEEARKYPDLMAILEEKVKPERAKLNVNTSDGRRRKERWWLWGRYTPALFRAIAQCDRVLVISRISPHSTFTFLPTGSVYSEQLIIFTLGTYTALCILQSRVHEIWARFFSGSALDLMRYAPSDCFETFPFPTLTPSPSPCEGEGNRAALSPCSTRGEGGRGDEVESTGQAYYEFRAALMRRNNQGLTATYNRFHDPDETDPDILHLRHLHAQCDRAVLDAYGWHDIPTACEFRLDYDDDSPLALDGSGAGGEGGTGEGEGKRGRKKPWRYRWPAAVHDEVLARLLKLNQERAETEKLGGHPNRRQAPAQPITADSTLPPAQKQLDLIPPDQAQLDLF